jgi:hypothetical protein
MTRKNYKQTSFYNLLFSYLISIIFIVLIFTRIKDRAPEIEIVKHEPNNTIAKDKVVIIDNINEKKYINRTTSTTIPTEHPSDKVYSTVIIDDHESFTYKDRVHGTIIKDGSTLSHPANCLCAPCISPDLKHEQRSAQKDFRHGFVGDSSRDGIYSHSNRGSAHASESVRDHKDNLVDFGLLDRRLSEFEINETQKTNDNSFSVDNQRDKTYDSFKNLVPVSRNDNDSELGQITDFNSKEGSYGIGKGGELYAYNFPSQGLGAGVGSAAVGAGAGGGAGLSAGIGEGLLNGESVPTLGGVGDGSKTVYGEPAEPAGVGGLLGGAGAGGAAGLTQGYITEKLGISVGVGSGVGNGVGSSKSYNDNHLPKNGSLHIMMHVDGSGSILNTRKQLEIMRDTLLKTALLPYYNNDENLYNKRVTIVDSSGERTLKFFSQAAQKNNVLAIAFQDEAQPAYHLPNFNKKPEDHYLNDLGKLKASLNGYDGLYRGVMFQVDRGKTFAKSFKEFVGNAFRGEGYLNNANLKKYHKDNNLNNIKNKNGIVFNDEYHAKDSGDPQYYLDLIFQAANKVGLDLNIYGAGLNDGKHVD